MKNLLFLMFAATLAISLFSCTEEDFNLNNTISKEIVQNEIEDEVLINNFINLQRLKLDFQLSNNITFDNNKIYEVSTSDDSGSMIMANQVGFDEDNAVNYAVSAALRDDGMSDLLIVKTSRVSDHIYDIQYLNSSFELISNIQLNSDTETIEVFNVDFIGRGCGQDVADCLQDSYSNHGWISVWAVVQTGFIPGTAVVLSLGCAMKNC